MGHSEADIQIGLFQHLSRKGHGYITPNAHLYLTGEMDMCSVMKSGKICEYEIKISRSDFKADFKKDKHRLINLRLAGITEEDRQYEFDGKPWGKKHTVQITTPHYFSYVVPTDLVAVDEVPKWAGLIYVHPQNIYSMRVMKRASQIHTAIDPTVPGQLGTKLMYRFWGIKGQLFNAPARVCSKCQEVFDGM